MKRPYCDAPRGASGVVPGAPLHSPSMEKPRLWERPPFFGYDLITSSVSSAWDGTDCNSVFPSLTFIDSHEFKIDIGLVGVVLTTSMINPVSDTQCGIFIMLGDRPTVDITDGSGVYLGTLTEFNSATTASPNPTNKSTSLSFGEQSAIRINSGQKMSLYACSSNSSTQRFSAVLTLYYIHAAKNLG